MKWSKSFTTLAMLFSLAFTVLAADTQTEEEKAEERLIALWATVNQRGHFVLEGNVVDEDGKPVPDFFVEYTRPLSEKEAAQIPKFVGSSEDIPETEAPDAPVSIRCKDGQFKFDVKYTDIRTFGLSFLAPGYYDTNVGLRNPISKEEYAALDKAVNDNFDGKGPLPKEILVKKNFSVVMRKKAGKPTSLGKWNVPLKLLRNGEWDVLQFPVWKPRPKAPERKAENSKPVPLVPKPVTRPKSPSEKEPARRMPTEAPSRQESFSATLRSPAPIHLLALDNRLPPRAIGFFVKRGKEGVFVIEQYRHSAIDDIDGIDDVPVDAKLVMNAGPDDGFILYKKKRLEMAHGDESVQYIKEPMGRGMGLAPERGYQRELPLSSSQLARLGRTESEVWFFFKCAGRYGRGQVDGFSIGRDRSEIGIYLRLEVQPDGSRSLETGE